MARTIGGGRPIEFDAARPMRIPQIKELVPQILTFFHPAKGLDTATRLGYLDRGSAPVVTNYSIRRGRFETRTPIQAMGTAAASPVMYAADFVTQSGTVYPFRLTTTGLDKWDLYSLSWLPVAGVALTGSVTDFFAVTAFGSKLLFSNGIDGLWEYDPLAGTATKIATSAKVPSAKHLTTFNGRVIATNVVDDTGPHPTRIRWSTKLNETFWDETDQVHIGAGFEDATASPELETDIARAVFPVTETLALLARSRSIWTMTATGYVDAPFGFSLLFPEMGTDSPYSIDSIPGGGIVGLFRDNFYVVTTQGPVAVGHPVIDALLPQISDPGEVFGTYEQIAQEYRVVIKETGAVWRYSFRDKGWTKDVYPVVPKSVATTRYKKQSLTIAQLTGTIASLVGTIEDLGTTDRVHGVYLPSGNTVYREDSTTTSDFGGTPVTTELRTGLILPESPLKTVEINEVQLEYELFALSATVTVEWSSDGGLSWNSYSTFQLSTTGQVPDVASVRKTVSAKQLQLRATTQGVTPVRIVALHAFVVSGAMRKP
jgi:hypothetical protein